jgi:hypothetical protein
MSMKKYVNLPCPECGEGSKVIASTLMPNGQRRRRCECLGPDKHRFWSGWLPKREARVPLQYTGPILTEWRSAPIWKVIV